MRRAADRATDSGLLDVDALASELDRLNHYFVSLTVKRAEVVRRRPGIEDLPAANIEALGISKEDHDVSSPEITVSHLRESIPE